MMRLAVGILCVIVNISDTCGQCEFPTAFRGSFILSKLNSIVSFQNSTLSGITLPDSPILEDNVKTDYECVATNGTKYVVKSIQGKVESGETEPRFVYFCMDITVVSSWKLTFVQATSTGPGRKPADMKYLTASLVGSDPISTICDIPESSYLATMNSVLLKIGEKSSWPQLCPAELLGAYTNQDSGCPASADVCTDNTVILVTNASLCSVQPFFSASGNVWCVHDVSNGNVTYLHVYNNDTAVDNRNTYRYTCVALQKIGDTVMLSQNPGDCTDNQTPFTPTTSGRAMFNFSQPDSTKLCPITTTTVTTTTTAATTPTTTSIPGVSVASTVGLVFGVLGLVSVVFLIVFCIFFCKKQKKMEDEKRKRQERREERRLRRMERPMQKIEENNYEHESDSSDSGYSAKSLTTFCKTDEEEDEKLRKQHKREYENESTSKLVEDTVTFQDEDNGADVSKADSRTNVQELDSRTEDQEPLTNVQELESRTEDQKPTNVQEFESRTEDQEPRTNVQELDSRTEDQKSRTDAQELESRTEDQEPKTADQEPDSRTDVREIVIGRHVQDNHPSVLKEDATEVGDDSCNQVHGHAMAEREEREQDIPENELKKSSESRTEVTEEKEHKLIPEILKAGEGEEQKAWSSGNDHSDDNDVGDHLEVQEDKDTARLGVQEARQRRIRQRRFMLEKSQGRTLPAFERRPAAERKRVSDVPSVVASKSLKRFGHGKRHREKSVPDPDVDSPDSDKYMEQYRDKKMLELRLEDEGFWDDPQTSKYAANIFDLDNLEAELDASRRPSNAKDGTLPVHYEEKVRAPTATDASSRIAFTETNKKLSSKGSEPGDLPAVETAALSTTTSSQNIKLHVQSENDKFKDSDFPRQHQQHTAPPREKRNFLSSLSRLLSDRLFQTDNDNKVLNPNSKGGKVILVEECDKNSEVSSSLDGVHPRTPSALTEPVGNIGLSARIDNQTELPALKRPGFLPRRNLPTSRRLGPESAASLQLGLKRDRQFLSRLIRQKHPPRKAWTDANGSSNDGISHSKRHTNPLKEGDLPDDDLSWTLPRPGDAYLDLDDARLRRLLEELYKDKKYMDKLLKLEESSSHDEVKDLAEYGRNYLLQRALYWEHKGPLPPRPATTALGFQMEKASSARSAKTSRSHSGANVI